MSVRRPYHWLETKLLETDLGHLLPLIVWRGDVRATQLHLSPGVYVIELHAIAIGIAVRLPVALPGCLSVWMKMRTMMTTI